jgi:hypothetical protein
MTVSTFFSQASAAQVIMHDAYTSRDTDPTNNDWSTFQNGAGTGNSYNSTQLLARIMSGSTKWIVFHRSQMLYNTADIGTDNITAAKWESVAKGTSAQDDYTASVTLCASDPANNNYSVSADYADIGGTKYSADLALTSQTYDNTTYTAFEMNAAGIAAINKTGITKLGIIITEDFDDQEPGEANVYADRSEWACWSTDETESGERRPRLVVTHAPAFTPTVIIF